MKRFAALIALIVSIGLVTGCAGIPRSGNVRGGNPVGEEDTGADVTLIADAPVPGASQQDLLRGFIAAASSPLNNYDVAREYLAPTFRLEWNPDVSVTLDDPGTRTFTQTDDSTIEVGIVPQAIVDASGVYSERRADGQVKQDYRFTKVEGEWRITAAPDGIVLEQSLFETVFDEHALQFFDPKWSTLVPDLRWFPSGNATATRVVTELLDGPSDWLAPAVTTAFPDGTKLSRSSVPVTDGEAQVDLSREALTADETARKRMKAQLVASLESVAGAGLVSILIDGQSVDVPSLTLRQPHVDSRPLVMSSDGFGYVGGSGIERIQGISDSVESLGASAASINSENTQVAVRAADGVYSVSTGETPVRVDGRADLIAPTIDDKGFVWSVPAGQPGKLQVHDADGAAYDVQTNWPEASHITSLQLSRDGTRVVALIESSGSAQLLLAGVRRSADGVPVAVGDTVPFPIGEGTPTGATWVDDRTVAVMTRDDARDIRLIELGGPSEQLAPLDDAVQIVGGNTADDLRAVSADGELLARRGAGWQIAREGVDFIATQLGSPAG